MNPPARRPYATRSTCSLCLNQEECELGIEAMLSKFIAGEEVLPLAA